MVNKQAICCNKGGMTKMDKLFGIEIGLIIIQMVLTNFRTTTHGIGINDEKDNQLLII